MANHDELNMNDAIGTSFPCAINVVDDRRSTGKRERERERWGKTEK